MRTSGFFVTWKSNDHFWLDSQSLELHGFVPQTSFSESPYWTATSDFFRQHFEQEWQAPECDARDALNYLLASPQERLRYAIRWVQGGIEEVERVVNAAMKVEFQSAITVSQEPDAADMDGVTWVRVNSSQPYTFSERFHRLLAVIDERNVRDAFDAYAYHGRGGIGVEVSISAPFMHEKIEARLFLFDWLREYAPQLLPDWE